MNQIPEAQRGAAEQLLALVLQSGAHLWHNRPGLNHDGVWVPATNAARARLTGDRLKPGLFVPAAVALYRSLVDIYRLNPELLARFASYAMRESDWRDLKVACAALMLVQARAGVPVHDDDGSVAFYDLSQNVSKDFLYYFFRSQTEDLRIRMYQGMGQPNLNTGLVGGILVPMPPPKEQASIAAKLDETVDRTRRIVDRIHDGIARLHEYRTALISSAVTGQIDVRSEV